MKINFYGKACFSIKDSDLTIVMDPHSGLKTSLKANVVTVSDSRNEDYSIKSIDGEPKVFDWPGEYETAGVHFQGIASFHNTKDSNDQKENTVFKIESNGINLCHLGWLGTKLTSEQLEEIGDVDILFIPVAGKNTIDAKKAKEVIEQIEPRVIIPMLYCNEDDNCGLGSLQPFLSEMGSQSIEPLDEFSAKKSELPEETSKIVVLKQQK